MTGALRARQFFEQGKVREAQNELTAYLREHPSEVPERTFLFELLCFSGDYDSAEKQLAALTNDDSKTELAAILYRSALHAERIRHRVFENQEFSKDQPASPPGRLNGEDFHSIRDADPDLGARLEVFAAGAYLWIPFVHIASVEIGAPTRLRDTLWAPALVRTGPAFTGRELGEVLIPAVYPFSWKDSNQSAWLGRITQWAADDEGKEYPSGQRVLLADGKEIPFLEIRSLEFVQAEPS